MGYPDERPIRRGAEPLFTLRGQDALAVPAIRAYIKECEEHGLPDQAATANETLKRIQTWQAENPKHTHLPSYGGGLRETL